MDGLAQRTRKQIPERRDSDRAHESGLPRPRRQESGTDNNIRSRFMQSAQQFRDIGRFVLTIAIDANHCAESFLKGRPVAGAEASRQTEPLRKAHHLGAGGCRGLGSGIRRIIVNHKDSGTRENGLHRAHDLADGCSFIVRGYDHHDFLFHARASSQILIRWRRTRWMNAPEPMRRPREISALLRSRAGKFKSVSK